jgi:hypothetical protein
MKSSAQQMQPTGHRVVKNPLPQTIEVIFDDTGFEETGYSARVGDTFRFINHSEGDLKVFVLTSDGSVETTAMLGSVSEVAVAALSYVDQGVSTSGTYEISLDEPPQLLAANDTGGGKTVTVIIST